ncbi:MAG TPA: MFS transporter [Bryobacteraceae bacterium]|jgi:OPA family glycerol-3-phosphate transporter-like MFS transporter|nr:MFS transporter [Bryobacteraceae bacterium]
MPDFDLAPAETRGHSLAYRQALTIALLFGGYAAYYFCRSDLSIAMPLIIQELQHKGVSAKDALIRLGLISSFGVGAYAAGKFVLTGLGDVWGGKRNFLLGLGGAVLFTILFALGGGPPIFTLAWIGNRLTQSVGWAGLIKVCSKWFSYSSYGTVAGVLSLSYLIGDALARQSMGFLIRIGFSWREIFYFAAAVAGVFFAGNLFALRESRTDTGFSEAEVNPLNLFCDSDEKASSLSALFKALLASRAFITVCLVSFGCTIVRETFGIWTPTYLHDVFHFSASSAGSASAIFPAMGAVSVLLTGWLSDQLGARGRSVVMFAGLSVTALALFALTAIRLRDSSSMLPLVLIGSVAFGLLGPYSYLAGAFALDFGGRKASAASSGIIDGVGYVGGILAGDSVARVAVAYGWRGVFIALGVVSALSALASGCLFLMQGRSGSR